ncbi:MAG: hypothetical protein AAF726_07725 [Planctomycetota bacterium]
MRPPHRSRKSALASASLALLASCASSPIADVGRMDAARVPQTLDDVRSVPLDQVGDDELVDLVADLLSANKAIGLETDTKVAVRSSLLRSAEELARRGENPAALEDLALADLPARIAVQSGLRSAQLYYDKEDRRSAYDVIRELDRRYPSHQYRVEAGDLLYEIADSYANDKRRRLFLFPYSNRAPGVFEYLSSEYPTHPQSDEALTRLARIYEDKRLYDIAIEKHRDLVLWSPDSPYRIASEAEIPRLRLADLDGPEYGRDSMMTALGELEGWLGAYPDEPLRPDVERTLVDCLQRLADNDMGVADFYRTVRSSAGARQHAARALEYAKRAGNEAQLGEIRDFLASLDEIEELGAPREIREGFDPEDIVPIDEFGGEAPAELAPGSAVPRARRTPRKIERAIEEDERGSTVEEPIDIPGGTGSGGGSGSGGGGS